MSVTEAKYKRLMKLLNEYSKGEVAHIKDHIVLAKQHVQEAYHLDEQLKRDWKALKLKIRR